MTRENHYCRELIKCEFSFLDKMQCSEGIRVPGPKYRVATGFAEIVLTPRPEKADLPKIRLGIVLQHQRSPHERGFL